MTTYEHAMLGSTLALAAGLHRRHGWQICVMAAIAAALPDWDGLSLAFGGTAYAKVHRVWGHNLLVATLSGAAIGGLGYWHSLSLRFQRATVSLWPRLGSTSSLTSISGTSFTGHALTIWIITGTLAGLSHLPADMLYSGQPGMTAWPIPLLWPFSDEGWVLPVVPWGDLITTLVFIGGMFAIYRWSARARTLACTTLILITSYVTLRWLLIRE